MESSGGPRAPGLGDALIPVVVRVVQVAAASTRLATNRPMARTRSPCWGASAALLVGRRLGHSWGEVQSAMSQGLAPGASAIFILPAVGAPIGAWILSGSVPILIL